jgi:hypothetical protein
MTSLFDQTERKRGTQPTKTPDLASSRPPDEFHVSHEEQFEKLVELWRDTLFENAVKSVVVVVVVLGGLWQDATQSTKH